MQKPTLKIEIQNVINNYKSIVEMIEINPQLKKEEKEEQIIELTLILSAKMLDIYNVSEINRKTTKEKVKIGNKTIRIKELFQDILVDFYSEDYINKYKEYQRYVKTIKSADIEKDQNKLQIIQYFNELIEFVIQNEINSISILLLVNPDFYNKYIDNQIQKYNELKSLLFTVLSTKEIIELLSKIEEDMNKEITNKSKYIKLYYLIVEKALELSESYK